MPRAIGKVSTSAATEVPVNATTYNEQSAGAQRSIKSSSASDTAAGTGARKVKVTYYTLDATGKITGPFTETVTLDGTNAVPLVATDLALLERMEVLTAGSGGVAAGDITLWSLNDGTGTAIAVLSNGDVRTRLAHHYVSSGARCELLDLEALGGDPASALVQVKRLPYPSGVEQPITGGYGTTSTLPRGVDFPKPEQAPINGPCRLRLTVTPANGNAQVTTASFGFIDRGNIVQGS